MNEAKCNCKKMSCDNRFCDRKHTHKTFSCPKCSDMNEDWKEKLQLGVLEDYLMEAKLSYAVKNETEHLERMRGHLEKLESFIKEQKDESFKAGA